MPYQILVPSIEYYPSRWLYFPTKDSRLITEDKKR